MRKTTVPAKAAIIRFWAESRQFEDERGAMQRPAARAASRTAWTAIEVQCGRSLRAARRCTATAARMSSAGMDGRMYPGSLERESEKNTMGTSAQRAEEDLKGEAGCASDGRRVGAAGLNRGCG